MQVGVLGGTGAFGRAISARIAAAGHSVIVGSRNPSRSEAVVTEIADRWRFSNDALRPGSIVDAAEAEIVVVALPFDVLDDLSSLASQLEGKAVLSAVNGLQRSGNEFTADLSDSAVQRIGRLLPDSWPITAFNHLPARPLGQPEVELTADVLLAGDVRAIEPAQALVESIVGLRAVDAGGFQSAAIVEAFTAVLLNINKRSGQLHGLRLAPA